jgi:hypothetical protein
MSLDDATGRTASQASPADNLASDYLAAALPLGLQPRSCAEPRWPPSDSAGGPLARQWCQAAADAAYEAIPAAIIWHFQRAEG